MLLQSGAHTVTSHQHQVPGPSSVGFSSALQTSQQTSSHSYGGVQVLFEISQLLTEQGGTVLNEKRISLDYI